MPLSIHHSPQPGKAPPPPAHPKGRTQELGMAGGGRVCGGEATEPGVAGFPIGLQDPERGSWASGR